MRRLLPTLGIGAICFLGISVASVVQAQSYVKEISYPLEQPFGGVSTITSFAQYLQLVYSYSAGLIGIIAVVLIMAGGIMWIGAAGNEQVISTAKEIIISALTAVVIIVLSYAILIFLNPRFVEISFSLQRIPIVDVGDFYKLPKCTDAPYTGKTCVNESAVDTLCDDIPCGEVGHLDVTGNCRGGATSCATGFGCYRDATNPEELMSCQLMACGERVNACADAYPFDDPASASNYASCICQHYTKMMTNFGVTSSGILPLYTDANQPAIYEELCKETTSNADWVTKVATAPYNTLFRGSPSQAATVGLNCGFSSLCAPTTTTTPSGCETACGPIGSGGCL